jgi:hypothetical protein
VPRNCIPDPSPPSPRGPAQHITAGQAHPATPPPKLDKSEPLFYNSLTKGGASCPGTATRTHPRRRREAPTKTPSPARPRPPHPAGSAAPTGGRDLCFPEKPPHRSLRNKHAARPPAYGPAAARRVRPAAAPQAPPPSAHRREGPLFPRKTTTSQPSKQTCSPARCLGARRSAARTIPPLPPPSPLHRRKEGMFDFGKKKGGHFC